MTTRRTILLVIFAAAIVQLGVRPVALRASSGVADRKPLWKVFSSRAGWSISYPGDWKVSSCRSCSDPRAPDVFVTFVPRTTGDSCSVMVMPLADKPVGTSVEDWFAEVKKTANLNRPLAEHRFTLNGVPALKVRYRNDSVKQETEDVYVISGSHTYSISFQSEKSELSLERLGSYHTYGQMVTAFAVK